MNKSRAIQIMTKAAEIYRDNLEEQKQEGYTLFAQEKYSNGETSLQCFEEYLHPNALYSYASSFHSREAYKYSAELSVYVRQATRAARLSRHRIEIV